MGAMPRSRLRLLAGRARLASDARRAAALVLAAGALGSWAAPAMGQNLCPNSSFEEGEVGWTLWHGDPASSSGGVSTDGPKHGRYCYRVENRGDKGANLFSDPIPCQPDSDYTLSVYGRTRGGNRLAVAAWGVDAEGETLSYSLGGDQFVPDEQPTYARIRKSFHTPAECTHVKAHLICNGGTVWWDAVQLENARRQSFYYVDGPPLTPEARAALPCNLICNSGFEAGELGWRLWHQRPDVSSGGVERTQAQEGSRAFHVIDPGDGGANLFCESFPCEPETEYTLSVWARVKGGRGVQIGGWGLDGAGQVLSYGIDGMEPLPSEVPESRRFTRTFTTPPGCTNLRAHLVCNGGEVWWDAVQIEQGGRATDYVAGITPDYDPDEGAQEAVAYTRAMIREARLRDALYQARRLCRYQANHPGAAEAGACLAEAEKLVGRVTDALQAAYFVPDFRNLDYGAVAEDCSAAESRLQELWRSLGVEPVVDFSPWQPGNEGLDEPGRLEQALVIFPCFTSERFFTDDISWDILEPFGFRIVSGWWGAQSRDGTLDASYLDTILAACAAHGYKGDIATSAAAGVVWLNGVLPEGEIYLHTAGGDWSPSGNCHSTINIWHPRVQEEAAGFLRAFGEHYRDDRRVVSYELENEPSLSIEKRVHGYKYERIGVGGYSPQARRAWREWLRGAYGEVEALNARWGTDYASFEAVAPPEVLTPPDPDRSDRRQPVGLLYDFQRFRAESHAEHFRRLVEALKAGDPAKPVMSQFIAGFGLRPDAACDLLSLAGRPDWSFLGTHDWPGAGPAVTSLFAYSMRRYAWRPHWEDEFIWSQWERKPTAEPEMRAALTRNLWRQVAWGKRGISLFNLETEWLHDSPNTWNNSMINIEADYKVPRYSTGAVPVVERKANLIKDTLFGTRLVNQGVALLRPTASIYGAAPELFPQRAGEALAAALLNRNLVPFVVPEECIVDGREDLSAYRVLVAPWAINVPEALQTRVLDWVRGGGALVALGPFGLFDEHGKPSGTLLAQAFGPVLWTYDREARRWQAQGLPEGGEGGAVPRGLGAGRVSVLPIAADPKTTDPEPVLALIRQALPVPPVATEMGQVELLLSEDDTGARYLFAVNLDRAAPRRGDVALRGEYRQVRELTVEGAPALPAVCADGVTTLALTLEAGEGQFFSLGRNFAPEE